MGERRAAATQAGKWLTSQAMAVAISVLIPVRDAMPWLPLAVRDALVQRNVRVEVVVVDDGSVDGSAQWLRELCDALGAARARCDPRVGADDVLATTIPAYAIASAASAGEAHRTNPAHAMPSMRKRPLPSAADAPRADPPSPPPQRPEAGGGGGAALVAAIDHADPPMLSKRKRRRLEKKRARAEAKARARQLREAKKAADAASTAAASAAPMEKALSAVEVAASVRAAIARGNADPRLVVVRNHGVGQGAALESALRNSTAALVAHIEADDTCGAWRLHELHRALAASHNEIGSRSAEERALSKVHARVTVPQPGSTPASSEDAACDAADRRLDAYFGPTTLSGVAQYRTSGMARYCAWQNSLLAPDALAAARYIELPSLHQTGLYERASLVRCAAADPTPGSAWGAEKVVCVFILRCARSLDCRVRVFARCAID